jgi:hypothetical protein
VRELGRRGRRNRRSPCRCRRACRPSEARGDGGTATSRGATNPSACAKTVIHDFCSSTKKPAQTQHTRQESPTGHRARGQLNDKPRTPSGLGSPSRGRCQRKRVSPAARPSVHLRARPLQTNGPVPLPRASGTSGTGPRPVTFAISPKRDRPLLPPSSS